MEILIDLQGCQSASRLRGIGRYSLALVTAILRNRGPHSIKLLLNGLYPERLDELRQRFRPYLPEEDILVFSADSGVAEFDTGNVGRARLAELARERLIQAIAPDAVLLTSLFEGFVDDAVTSVGLLGGGPFTAVTLYDLIPYLNPDPNWPEHYKNYYSLKIASLKRADLLLSISDYARSECIEAIPELGNRVVNMSSACDTLFQPGNGSSDPIIANKFGLDKSFVLSAGTLEPRKNFELLVAAFGALPKELTYNRLLVFVGSADVDRVSAIHQKACEAGLEPTQLRILGHVSDEELLALYRTCELFVFPSFHEGFGLPPLEAMACGAVVLGSNATSVPEVIGCPEALFDPNSQSELEMQMTRALTDDGFRSALRQHGLRQAAEFSWDKTARRALHAIEEGMVRNVGTAVHIPTVAKPRVAMVSPLPPERTGIADYVAELLPTLGETYDITVISDQSEVWLPADGTPFVVRSVEWFEQNAGSFERIVYQMGNSPFHAHMLGLMQRHPGVVVLHDFFLSSLMLWAEQSGYRPSGFRHALLSSHGYRALEYLAREGEISSKFHWPCSYDVVRNALSVIVHSDYSRQLARGFYGDAFVEKMHLVRQHRATGNRLSRIDARRQLAIGDNEILVCAFGFMDVTKLNHVLLDAWSRSGLAIDANCMLVFVGGEAGGEYGLAVSDAIGRMDGGNRVRITGFADHGAFEAYLSAVDIAVQLRTMSRGETSRTVLDCMAHGVPLIANAHGPMAEYPDEVLVKLADEFDVEDLASALRQLRADPALRNRIGLAGYDYICNVHALHKTVAGYAAVIEATVTDLAKRRERLAAADFWRRYPVQETTDSVPEVVAELLHSPRKRRIYLDISATVRNDLKTGIERVARSLLRELLLAPPPGYDVVPVYLANDGGIWRVRRAQQYLAAQPGFALVEGRDNVVIPLSGDALVGLDLFSDGVIAAAKYGLYSYWRASGAKVGFMIFDLLPITRPEFFPPWASSMHSDWVTTVCSVADMLVCISAHVRDDLAKWVAEHRRAADNAPSLLVSHLGADVAASFPTLGLPSDAGAVLATIESRPTFLMVGTIEPRKGHLQVVRAFERLWRRGVDVNLVIVGHEGWKPLPDEDRRTIPTIVDAIRTSTELGQRLFWLEGISDEYLERIYAAASCLLAASEDEGYGLPLVEAAKHGVPIIARDIQVFREVAGDHAFYFLGVEAVDLERAVDAWLTLRLRGSVPNSDALRWDTWAQSAQRFARLIVEQLDAS